MTFAPFTLNPAASAFFQRWSNVAADARSTASSAASAVLRAIPFLRSEDRLFRTEAGQMRPRLLAANRPDAPRSAFETIAHRGQDVRLHYFESGTPRLDEGPLFLIHGFASNAYQWNRLFDELADKHHVIAIDLPGHGYSDALADNDYDLVTILPEILNAFLKRKGMKDVTLVGSSLGGGFAQVLAAGNDRIRQLLLFASLSGTGQVESVAPFINALRLSAPLLLDRAPPYFLEQLGAFLTLMLYIHPTLATLTAYDVGEFARPYRGNLPKIRARTDLARRICEFCAAAENQTRFIEIQKNIRQPVLYIASEADRIVPPSVPGSVLRFIPNSRLIQIGAREVPTAGHTVMSDTPKLALQIIEESMDGTIDLSPATAGTTRFAQFNRALGRYEYSG